MEKDAMDLAVYILFFEKVDQTIECIQSFLPSKVPIFILNNGSTQESHKKLNTFCNQYNQINFFDSDKNVGVSRGRNFLISNTNAQWLFFVDNDIVVKTKNWIEKLNKSMSCNPNVDVFIPKLFNKHDRLYHDYSWSFRIVGGHVRNDVATDTKILNWFPGGASIVNRRVFDNLGLYDEEMFVGGEDFEFCIRAIRKRRKIVACVIDDIELIHDHRVAIEENDKNAVAIGYDDSLYGKSFQRIAEKHSVIFDGKWQQYTKRQKIIIAGKMNPFKTLNWIGMIPHPVKKIIKRYLYSRVTPVSCSLFMTFSCNFKCKLCRRNVALLVPRKNMELSVIVKLLGLYPKIQYFTLAGFGEPTLCPDFCEIVNFLKENRKYVDIITNGSNIEPFLKLHSEPNSISISLYGYDSESYLKNTGSDGFERVTLNFKKLKSTFKSVGFSFILSKKNYQDMEKIIRLCDVLKPDFLDFHNYLPYSSPDSDRVSNIISLEDNQIIEYIDRVCGNRQYIRQKPQIINMSVPSRSCQSHNYVINLDGEGNIGGCQRQIPPDPAFGNIFSDSNPFKSPKMREIREKIKKKEYPFEECQYCFGNFE
jgi:MoaA/NifB/PqqE/SkfB family radical SAM enzyme/GT2 family glycosyltransferase